jgi:hypothetical protein
MSILESHLELLEREVGVHPNSSAAESAIAVEDAISVHLALFDVLERRIGTGGLSEQHRPLVPLFQRWLDAARRIVKSAAKSSPASGLDGLLRAINRAKPAAEDFDRIVALNNRTTSGETGTYRPLSEVVNGVRSSAQPLR